MTPIKTLVLASLSALTLTSFAPPAAAAASLTLAVATPAGAAVQLEFHEGEGWRAIPADEARAVKVALNAAPAAAVQPLSVFVDRPTGGTFVYLADEGWKYLGRADADRLHPAARQAGAALTMLVDGPSGFVYTYAAEQGWKFAGRVGDMKF